MTTSSRDEARLSQFTTICLAFPEATRQDSGHHATFRVRGKTFAYYLDDHHGDGIVALCCKVEAGWNAALVASHPARFYLPAYLGPKGWVALRLDRGDVDWDEAAGLAADSYCLIAPKPKPR